ncbi:Hsp20 family protein [candidate division WWE3 bacterium]|nr:Hsp20 family protein [candidate division WWE3 bacterium]
MAIVKWNPYFPTSFFDDDNWMEPFWGGSPASSGLDVYETDENVVVEAQVPGIPEEDVDISVEGNVLTIEASTAETQEERDEKTAVYRETRQRSFRYSVNLPRGVNADKAEAEVNQGLLKITVPIAEEEKRKKIEVKTSK